MARKVFFSFHFQRDAWRVSQVRNSNVVSSKYERSQYLDGAAWEELQRKGKQAIKTWINSNLKGTSVTVVLIGSETNSREWVHYEIQRSWEEGKGLLGIRIHKVKDRFRNTDSKGDNPFRRYYVDKDENLLLREDGEDEFFGRIFPPKDKILLSSYINTYDWVDDNGRVNIATWIEAAAKQAGR